MKHIDVAKQEFWSHKDRVYWRVRSEVGKSTDCHIGMCIYKQLFGQIYEGINDQIRRQACWSVHREIESETN